MLVFKKKFKDALEEQIQNTQVNIASGSCSNLKDYGISCGTVRGLKYSLAEFDELWNKYIGENNDGFE